MNKTWIVAEDTEITQSVIDAADAAGCFSIAQGIPPRVAAEIDEGDLPCAYEPPTKPEPPPEGVTYWAQVAGFDAQATKPLQVTRVWQGDTITLWTYVTEQVKDAYLAGNLATGDFVLVVFVDSERDKPIATQKVFKSW